MHDEPTLEPTSPADPAAEEREFEAQLAATRRRRRLVLLVFGIALLTMAGGVAAYVATRPEPRCDAEDVDAFLSDPRIPAEAIGRVCRFDEPLAEALDAVTAAPPGMGSMLVMRAISEDPTLITEVCGTAAVRGLAETGQLAAPQKSARFLESCPLEGDDLFASSSELERAPFGNLITAIAVYSALRDSDPQHAGGLARRVLTGL